LQKKIFPSTRVETKTVFSFSRKVKIMRKWDNFCKFRFAKIFVLRENFRFNENFWEHLCINFIFCKNCRENFCQKIVKKSGENMIIPKSKIFAQVFVDIFSFAKVFTKSFSRKFSLQFSFSRKFLHKFSRKFIFSFREKIIRKYTNITKIFASIFVIFVYFRMIFSRKEKINFHEIFAKIRKWKFSFQPCFQPYIKQAIVLGTN
jgi:hypothetical protein